MDPGESGGSGGWEGRLPRGTRKALEEMNVFVTVLVVVASWVNTYVGSY